MNRFVAVFFCVCAATAQQQPDPKPELLNLTDQIDSAIQAGDWNRAAALSRSLNYAADNARNRSMAKGSTELIDQILEWLPPDTETLVVAQQPFKVMSGDQQAAEGVAVMARGYVLFLLDAIEKESLIKVLAGRTIRVAAVGARKFGNHDPDAAGRAPLGLIKYEGCAVYSFAEEVPEAIFQRPADESIMGRAVWISKGSQNDFKDTDTYLAALPKPDLMLVCNNRDFFTQMISRMAVAQPPRALPTDLKAWQFVDRSAPVWAIRHFRRDRAADDPTFEMIGGKDSQATGLAAEFGMHGGAKGTMISKSDPWAGYVKLPDFEGAATSRTLGDGVWELAVTNNLEGAAMAVFVLMAYLGFVVLI